MQLLSRVLGYTYVTLWLLQIMVVVEEEVMGPGAGVGMGGVVTRTRGDEGEEGGCKVAGRMGTLIILSPARGAGKVAGVEAVEDRHHLHKGSLNQMTTALDGACHVYAQRVSPFVTFSNLVGCTCRHKKVI